MQKNWVNAIIALSIIGLIFGWVRHADARSGQEALQLLNTVKPYMVNEQHITFKYTGYYGTCAGSDLNILQTGKKLSQAFDIPQKEQLGESNSHAVYTASMEIAHGTVVTLTVASPAGSNGCYTVLKLEASEQADQSELMNWQEQAGDQLKKLGIQGQWNMMVQGYVNDQVLYGKNSANEVIQVVAQSFKGKTVESYSDSKTISLSLASDEFQTSIQSGNQTVNLQLALHQESTSGKWRLTAGTPIITMEY
ncbi:YwmB family TATA-box binding protein [Paenibacillus sp. CGMCC 1.16610]|uniref:TATA-box binding protein n=1 Tax=Paenibacillus anseongense TaxID=2682845 RepID=A0ABW9U0Q7_9BACL|nr:MULTISPECIES: YwmB family TATA-box binding protein [Paenibacillus]MBA2943529.1 YwmB family TATA-box binding protein [Paenibacillus sp. CGMCC 1.16610]MVQ33023.1 hypothetical protein [Paenibacillus anseongense]